MAALEALSTITFGDFSVDNSTWFGADENIYAGYAMYTGESGPWGILAGVRVEATNAKYAFYDADTNGDNTVYTRVRHAYVDVFPTVQLRYEFSDDLVARATYSSGIGRPGFNQVAQPTSVNTDTNTINIGNPNLKPVTGNNFDLDVEYYLNDGGIVELGAFDKEFQNYNYSTKVSISGDPRLDPSMPEFAISSGNLDSSYARGVEAAYQQKFTFLPKPFDGFGLESNVSYVASSGALRTGEAGHALPGTSPVTMNVSLFYEAYGLDLRLSSQYMAHSLYQVGGNRAQDVFEDSRFTLDWTSSYELCDSATVYFNVKNITNSPLRIFMGSPNWPIQREFYDQTFESGVRLKL
jgi:TonB-dependent receptor